MHDIFSLLQYLMKRRSDLGQINGQVQNSTDRLVIRIGKVYLSLIQSKLTDFCLFKQFPSILEVYWQWIEGNSIHSDDEIMKRILIQGLMMFKYLNKHPNVVLSG